MSIRNLALRVEVLEAERERVRRIPTDNLSAYDAWLRGMEYWWRLTQEGNTQARLLFERAIELDHRDCVPLAQTGTALGHLDQL